MNLKRMVLAMAVSVVLLQIPAVANVTTGTWIMDQSNTFADGVNYGSVAISANDGTGVVSFTVDAFTAPYSSISNNFGIQTFGFNSTIASNNLTIGNLPAGWSAGSGNEDGFGFFMVTTDGTGNNRQDPLTFSVTTLNTTDAVADNFAVLSSGNAGQGNVFFAAHVAGFTVIGSDFTSNFIGGGATPTVPAPGAILLGGIGVSIVGWLKRRRAL